MTITTPGNAVPRRGARGAKAPLPLSSVPFTIVIAASMAGPKIPAFVGDSWRPTTASVLALAPLAAVAAVSAMSLMGIASATPTLHADALTAHTTTTSGGTTPRPGTRGAWTPLPLANAPFTTVIAASVTDPKFPRFVGDSWRPTAASLLGAAPLAAVAAVSAMSLMGTTSAAPTRQADASTAQACATTVAAGALGQLKWPDCTGD